MPEFEQHQIEQLKKIITFDKTELVTGWDIRKYSNSKCFVLTSSRCAQEDMHAHSKWDDPRLWGRSEYAGEHFEYLLIEHAFTLDPPEPEYMPGTQMLPLVAIRRYKKL